LEFCNYVENGFDWEGVIITMADIADGVAKQNEEQSDWYKPYTEQPKEWHISRIIYFVNDPNRITPINIDNFYHYSPAGTYIFPVPIIEDGHHRFAAIVYLGLPKFKATYGGRIDVLRYLEGKRKTKPE